MSPVEISENLPLSFDQITPAFLTRALSRDYPGAIIGGIGRDAEFFGTAASVTLALDYADTGGHADLPLSIHVKGGFDDVWRKRTWVVLQQEARYYAELAGQMPVNQPRCHFAAISDEPQGIVVLEDLTRRDVRFCYNLQPFSVDEVAAMLEMAARMHARWWENPRLADYTHWREAEREYLKYSYRPKHWNVLLEWKHGDLLEKVLRDPATAVRSLERLWEILDPLPRSFLHGDMHGGNIYFEPGGRPGLVDWQLSCSGHVVHDFGYLIVTAFTVEQRRVHEREMVRHYLEVLKAELGHAPGPDEGWLLYRQFIAHAMSAYGAVPRDNGPRDFVEGAAERAFVAGHDHDLLRVLGLSAS